MLGCLGLAATNAKSEVPCSSTEQSSRAMCTARCNGVASMAQQIRLPTKAHHAHAECRLVCLVARELTEAEANKVGKLMAKGTDQLVASVSTNCHADV